MYPEGVKVLNSRLKTMHNMKTNHLLRANFEFFFIILEKAYITDEQNDWHYD